MEKIRRSKKAAFEMSMSTIVIIVLAVIFLILGLVLLKSIFGVATGSIGNIDEKLKTQLSSIFAEENDPTYIKPEDGVVKVRAGTTNFGFIIGGRSKNGNDVIRGDLQYRLILDKESPDNCIKKPGIGETKVKSWFVGSKIASSETDNIFNNMNTYNSDMAFERIQVNIPPGTPLCTQKVFFDVIDTTDKTATMPIGGGVITVEVLRKSLV